jgi:hypothetical protein
LSGKFKFDPVQQRKPAPRPSRLRPRVQPIPRPERPVPHPQGWDWAPGEMATRALEATTEKSNRAIAVDVGVGQATVGRLRRSTELYDQVDRTVGLDGKSYPARRDRKGADNV